MRIWLACFVALFALAELFDWVKDFSLPLPIYILGGAFLAVVSNYEKLINTYNPTSNLLNHDINTEVIQTNPPSTQTTPNTTPIAIAESQSSTIPTNIPATTSEEV